MKIAQYITYSTFSKKEPTFEELKALISKLDSRQVLAQCCTIGVLLRLWTRQGADPVAYRGVIRGFFEPQIAALILELYPNLQVFSRRQLLIIERLAIETYNENKNWSYADFGRVALMVNDHLHYGLAGTALEHDKMMRNLFVEMIPITEDAGSSFLAKLSRAVTLIEEIATSLSGHADYVDIAAEFQAATGVSLWDFQAACAGMLTKWVSFEITKQPPISEIFLNAPWFASSAIDTAIVEKVIGLLTADVQTYAEAFATKNKRREDLTPFREHPLLRIGALGYMATDLSNLSESFEASPFWTVNAAINSVEKSERLLRFWGAVFEEYVNRVTGAVSAGELNTCVPSPQFEKGGQVCDLMVICGEDLVLIEAKGIMMTRESKYSGDVDACFKEVEKKFVKNEKNKNKGVSQLDASIRRIFVDKDAVKGVDMAKIKRVFPVVVSLDSVGENPLFSNVLNLYFDANTLTKSCGVQIERVLGIGIESFEHMTTNLSLISLSSLLSDWLANPSTPEWMGSYAMIDTPLTRSLGEHRNPYIHDRFVALTARVAQTLFPNAETNSGSASK